MLIAGIYAPILAVAASRVDGTHKHYLPEVIDMSDSTDQALPAAVSVINVVGGLAQDSQNHMPLEQQQAITAHWVSVSEETGAEFNFDFWEKYSSFL